MIQTELKFRRDKIRSFMAQQGIDAALIACNANMVYTYGTPVCGYLYLPLHSPAVLFYRRLHMPQGEQAFSIRKPEDIMPLLKEHNLHLPTKLMLEGDELSHTEYLRLEAAFAPAEVVNGSALIRQARSVKTHLEIEMFRRSAQLHARAYNDIAACYRQGMTDLEFAAEVEKLMRLQGCLGLFRTAGREMESFNGSIVAGDNALVPSPYDFTLGGRGLDPSFPLGVAGIHMEPGQTVMVDVGGSFYGYICDMSRTFSIGQPSEEAKAAHQACIEIQDAVAEAMVPGVTGEKLYTKALAMAEEKGYKEFFMGATHQAKFIGHGIGIEINEQPVLAARQQQPLEAGMVIALEPKIVLPGVGPVGVENSWVIANEGAQKLTICPEEIVPLL